MRSIFHAEAALRAMPSGNDMLLRKRAAQAHGSLPLGSAGEEQVRVLDDDLLQAKHCAQMRRARYEEKRREVAASVSAAEDEEHDGVQGEIEGVAVNTSVVVDGDMLLAAKRMARARRAAFEREGAAANRVQRFFAAHSRTNNADANLRGAIGSNSDDGTRTASSAVQEASTGVNTTLAPSPQPTVVTAADAIFRDADAAAEASTPSKQSQRRRSLDGKRMSFGQVEGSPHRSQLTDVSNSTPTRRLAR